MINIYSLYKKQHEKQKIRIGIYEKVLQKCHKRIKYIANIGKQETYFIVPEYMFGVPLYKQIACVCFLMIKLRKNGFDVKYTHPNFIYISWKHYNDEAQYNYTLNIPQIEFNSPEEKKITYNDSELEIRRLPTTTIKKKNINHYKNLNDKLIAAYFLLTSILIWPIQQEYFDPLIMIMAFTFFSSKLFINYKNSIFLFCYLSILLVSSNIYYLNFSIFILF